MTTQNELVGLREKKHSLTYSIYAFSALTLLVGLQEDNPACEN